MLRSVLEFFQKELAAYLQQVGVKQPNVAFPQYNGSGGESIDFVKDALNLLMINLEEENTLRQADIFRQEKNGQAFPALPEIRLNLYLLFVANRSDYLASMDILSLTIRFFQARRVFSRLSAPGLPEEVEKLAVELVTLPFAQQNEVWNALRTAYKPSALYRVRMAVFRQEEPLLAGQPVIEIEKKINE